MKITVEFDLASAPCLEDLLSEIEGIIDFEGLPVTSFHVVEREEL